MSAREELRAPSRIGPAWRRIYNLPRTPAADVVLKNVPGLPGVYAWFLKDVPVYAGKASGVDGVRGRLRRHLAIGLDLSRSSLRRNVADYLLGIPTAVTRARPTRMMENDVAVINDWIRQLTVCWLVLPSGESAVTFERDLLAEWMPPLGRR